jgi:hypothetical protein
MLSGVRLRSLIFGGFLRRARVVGGLVGAAVLLVAPDAVAAPLFSPVSGSPFGTASTPLSVAFSPGGGLLATANLAGSVSEFSVDASTGALTPVAGSPFGAGSGTNAVSYGPGGNLLATADYWDDTVSMFAVCEHRRADPGRRLAVHHRQ